MNDTTHFSMHQMSSRTDHPTIRHSDRLVPQTDAKDGYLTLKLPH